MKFIHTADIRLDRCYADQHLPSQVGRENRLYLRQRLLAIFDHAQKTAVDGVLIAGNLFERDRVERETLSFLRTAIAAIAPIPVVITPGCLDPICGNSPYETEIWPENAHIFSTPTWASIQVGDCTIYGFAHDERTAFTDPFAAFDGPEEDGPFMLMGAGTVSDDATNTVSVDLTGLTHPQLAYVALGHHSDCIDHSVPDGMVAWSCGAPAESGFGDSGPHHVLEVNLATSSDVRTSVTPGLTEVQRFLEIQVDCTDFASGQALIDTIRPQLQASTGLLCVRVVLSGALLPDIYDEMTSVRETLAEEVSYLEIIDGCFVAEDFATLAEQKTSLGAFLARINLEIEDAPDEIRRAALCRSRDLALCAYRGQHLPIRAAHGD